MMFPAPIPESPHGGSAAPPRIALKQTGGGKRNKKGSINGGEEAKITSIRKSCDFCNRRKKKCDGDGVHKCRQDVYWARSVAGGVQEAFLAITSC